MRAPRQCLLDALQSVTCVDRFTRAAIEGEAAVTEIKLVRAAALRAILALLRPQAFRSAAWHRPQPESQLAAGFVPMTGVPFQAHASN